MALIANTNTPYNCPTPDLVSVPIAQALPVPPMAWGFTELVDFGMTLDRVTWFETAALHPAGSHTEPRKGQIWPR